MVTVTPLLVVLALGAGGAPLRCANAVAVNAANLAAGVLRCHVKTTRAALRRKGFSEEPCENGPRGRYDARTRRLRHCATCLDPTTIGNLTQSEADAFLSGAVYCDATSGRHIGDDSAFLPSGKPATICENRVALNVAALVRAALGCAKQAAIAQAKGQLFDVAACYAAAVARYDSANATLTGCPACVNPAAIEATALPDFAKLAARIYCGP